MSELTISTKSEIRIPNFKNEKLREYTQAIAADIGDMTNRANSVALNLGHVLESKCYEDDGFQSVADYAESVFGINRTQAYRMAKTAARFLLEDKAIAANDTVQQIPLNNLAELVTLTDEQIEDAINSGKLTPDTKQTEIRQLVADSKPDKVYKGPDYAIILPNGDTLGTPAKLPLAERDLKAELEKGWLNADGSIANYTMVKCKPNDKGTITCHCINKDTAELITFWFRPIQIPDSKPNKTKTTPGAAVAAAVAKYKAAHDGKEPDMATLLSLLK